MVVTLKAVTSGLKSRALLTNTNVLADCIKVLAVANELRPMTWIDDCGFTVPPRLADTLGLRKVESSHLDFTSVFNKNLISVKDHDSLIDRYIKSRDPSSTIYVDPQVGRALGYLRTGRHQAAPAYVYREYRLRVNRKHCIARESFGQRVYLDSKILKDVAKENDAYKLVFDPLGIDTYHAIKIG